MADGFRDVTADAKLQGNGSGANGANERGKPNGKANGHGNGRIEDGATLLEDVHAFLRRFVAYPSDESNIAHALWVAHAHLMEAWESTPRLAFLSPEPESGKTRALEVTEPLVPRPIQAVNATSSYLFRKAGDPSGTPTILFDEIDTIFGPRAKENEEIRGFLNAGHRRGQTAGRCVVRGRAIKTEDLPAYCAVAMAGLGNLPDTILSRSVIIPMRRRAPYERVESYRRRFYAKEGEQLRDRLAVWACQNVKKAETAVPEMPPGVDDRAADLWEPLLTVADLAGGPWPKRARVSAVSLVSLSKRNLQSLGIRLLADLKLIFGDRQAMHTGQILTRLHALEESPWADLKGKPLTDRKMASILKRYDIRSKQLRVEGENAKGYAAEDLRDIWSRYLGGGASPSSHGSETSETLETEGELFGPGD